MRQFDQTAPRARTNRHRRSLGAGAAVSIVIAQCCTVLALADSATGVDTALGNALNPPGRSRVPRPLAGDGLDVVRRSPTGQLYGLPYAYPDERNRTDGGWYYAGGIEIGVLGGDPDKRSALFRKYKDLDKGLYLDYFAADGDKPDTAHYFQVVGGGAGQSDQFYGLQFGRYNDWKVKVFFNGTPHVFTDSYKPLFDGAGSGILTLAGGQRPMGGATPVTSGTPGVGTGACTTLAPCWRYTSSNGVSRVFSNATALIGINWTGGAATAAGTPVAANSIAGSLNTYLSGVDGNAELRLERQKFGATAELRLSNRWKGYAGFTQELRSGSRPFGMNENNYTVEIPEPIDYTTHDFLAGLSYVDPRNQFNLRAAASLFRNDISSLTVQQPWLAAATGIAAVQSTIYDLYPDNSAFSLKAEFARNLPEFLRGRFTANAAWSTSKQDDALMLPVDPAQTAQVVAALGTTIVPGINNPGYATNTLDLRNWDGTNGFPLSQHSARQQIDSRLLNVGLSLRPLDALTVKGDVRRYETDNNGGYTAYNPLTGQFGRGFRNSTAFDLVVGSSGAPGAIGVPCYAPAGFVPVPGCTFNGNAGVVGQSTNNPANVPVIGPPREVKQTNYSMTADYDIGRGSSLNGTLEREDFHRTYREREKTREDRIKIGYVNRGFEQGTLRLSYEDGRRRGSEYEFWPVTDFGTGLPGLDWTTIVTQYLRSAAAAPGWTVAPASLAGYLARYAYESRKYDQADRDRSVFNARINYMARDDLDLALSFQQSDVTFPDSGYGLEKDRSTSINIDANFQLSTEQQIYGYVSRQSGRKGVRANSGTNAAGASNTCAFTTGAALTTQQVIEQCAQQVWLAAAAWNMDTADRSDVFGLGLQRDFGRVQFAFDYTYSFSRTSITYDYGANVLTPAQAVLAGSAFPDMTLIQHTLSAHLVVPVTKQAAVHLVYRHESGRVTDWHYTGVPIGASAAENNATLMLDAGPQNYHTNVIGVLFQARL